MTEVNFKLTVDTADGAAVIANLQKQLEGLKNKLAEVKTTASSAVPKDVFDPLKNPPVNNIESLNKKLKELKTALSKAEIGSDSFKELSIAVKETETQLNAATKAAKTLDVSPAAGSIADLRAKVKEMTAEINNVEIGSKRFKELEEQIFKANSQLKNTKNDLKGASDEQIIGSFVKIGQGAVAGFAAASSAVSLYTGKSKSLEEVQRAAAKAQEYLTLVTSLGAVATAYHESREAVLTVSMKGRAAATSLVAGAQRVLNLVMEANPIGILIVAVTALVTAFITLKDKVAIIGDAFKFLTGIFDKVISGLKFIGQAVGLISDDTTNTLKKSLAEQFQDAVDHYDNVIKVAEAAHKNTAELEAKKLQIVKQSIAAQILMLEDLRLKNGELNEDQLKQLDELKKKQDANNADIKVQAENTAKALRDEQAKTQQEKLNALADGYAKEVALTKQATADKIQSIKDSTLTEQAKAEQIKAITQQGQNELAKLGRENLLKRLQTENALAIAKTEEGTKERLDAEVSALEKERDYNLKYVAKTEDERNLIKENARNAIREKTLEFERKTLEEENQAAINSTIEGSAKRFQAQVDAIEKERKFKLDNEAKTEAERININVEADAQIRELHIAAIQADFDAQQQKLDRTATTEQAITNTKLIALQDQLQNEALTNDERFALMQQVADAQLELARKQSSQEQADLKQKYDEENALRVQALTDKQITQAQFDEQQKAADDQFNAEKAENAQKLADKELSIEKKKNKDILNEKIKNAKAVGDIAGGISNVVNGLMNLELESAGDNEKKKKEIRKKYAVIQMEAGIIQTVANTAASIMSTSRDLGFPAAIPFIAIAAAEGAVQVATLIQQKNKTLALATGGPVAGPGTDTSDSIPAFLSNGEYVINAAATRRNLPLIEAINANPNVSFTSSLASAPGGYTSTSTDNLEDRIANAIQSTLGSLPPTQVYVSEADITRAQKKVSVNESRAKFG